MFVLLVIIVGFFLGVVTVLAIEAVGVVLLIEWLNKKTDEQEKSVGDSLNSSAITTDLDPSIFYNKQGFVWILESSKIPKGWPFDKVPKEQRPKNEILEVTPERKHAKLVDHCLILIDPDGSQTEIPLRSCKIEAVSASGLPTRKWGKRFPVKVEGKESDIYKGCKMVFVYLETSWEKESWCKALRLASCDDKEKLNWVTKLSIEFHNYVTSLNTEYPSFIKPSTEISVDPADISLMSDGSSSKVRQFLKRLTKKASKKDIEVKTSTTPTSSSEEKKKTIKSYSFGDSAFPAASERMVPAIKPTNAEGNKSPSLSTSSVITGKEGQSSKNREGMIFSDEGTLCWNLLISRLFFDAKNNMQIKTALQSRIQRTLSNMRTPGYIGEITCTSVDTGNVPPHVHGMRVLASDMNEVWAFEIDIEYAGGAVLDVETRLEVGELDVQKEEELNNEFSSVGDVTTDLLEGMEYFGKQSNISEDAVADMEPKTETDHKQDDSKSSKILTRASSQVSRWKSMLHSVAKQVSQVPLCLGIKVASLRGTVRLYIKPPPSDQIWFGFTSMPEIELSLDSFVGEHKVTSGHLALFLISRFKASIRETLVLPNCESVNIPFMLADKDDWVPRKVAPFMWIHQDSVADTTNNQETPGSRLANVVSEVVNSTNKQEVQSSEQGNAVSKIDEAKHDDSHTPSESLVLCAIPPPVPRAASNDHLSDDSSMVLQNQPELLETISTMSSHEMGESRVRSRSVSFSDEPLQSMENDEMRPQRLLTKARMLSFRKKMGEMGEKLEEKRRHLGEKGRHLGEKGKTIVEKMRESKLNN